MHGEQDVKRKDSLNESQEKLAVKTGNNQINFLFELFGSGLEVKFFFAPSQWPIYRPVTLPQGKAQLW